MLNLSRGKNKNRRTQLKKKCTYTSANYSAYLTLDLSKDVNYDFL